VVTVEINGGASVSEFEIQSMKHCNKSDESIFVIIIHFFLQILFV
jgi:hypothetical protein